MALRLVTRSVVGLGGATAAMITYRYQTTIKRRQQDLPTQSYAPTSPVDKSSIPVYIIGGGVVGVTTAYKLALQNQQQRKNRYQIIVLEPRDAPGTECSRCAAGGMQISNPSVDANTWMAVTKCLLPITLKRLVFGSETITTSQSFNFFNISWKETLTDPFFIRWLYTFTKTSLFPSVEEARDHEAKQTEMLNFTNYAVNDMVKLFNRHRKLAKAVGYNPNGSLSLVYDEPAKKTTDSNKDDSKVSSTSSSSANPTSSKMNFEPSRRLDQKELLSLEPSIRHQVALPTQATFQYQARAASAERFTQQIEAMCNKIDRSVTFDYGCKVQGITMTHTDSQEGRIAKLHTNKGVMEIPDNAHIVVAAGAWTPHVLSLIDLYVPVYPLTGYAMSLSAKEVLRKNRNLRARDLPQRIVADKYMFTSRLGEDEIRITSIGEFQGWSTSPTPSVDAEFRREAKRQFPQMANCIDQAKTYCGHRPYVNDGILILGAVPNYRNLYVSCGPGSNGWKLAMGSGEVIARLVSGQTPPQIQSDLGFDCGAFSPARRVLYAPLFAKVCRVRWDI